MPYPNDLETIQWARESVAGTDLACTSKVVCERFNPIPSSPDAYRPAIQRGLMLANRGGESVIQRGTDWTLEGPLTFEQAQHLFNGAIQNVDTPTGGPAPYVWTHTRNPANIPTLATYTFERRVTDGSTPIDHAFHYAVFRDLELTFGDQVWMYNASGFARRVQTESQTGALSLPSFEICTTPSTKIWIDSTWAALGTTQITGQILSGSIKFGSSAGPLWTADGRSDLDFTQVAYASSRSTLEVSLTLLLGAQFATEKAAAEAMTLRAVRVQIDGTVATRQIQLDMLLKYVKPELYGYDYNDEQTVVTLNLVGSTDGTNAWQAKVTNSVATLV